MKDDRMLSTLHGAGAQVGRAEQAFGQPEETVISRSRAVQVRVSSDAQAWKKLFNTLPHPHITQSRSYAEGKHRAGNWHPVYLLFERGSRPVAMCQALQVRVAGWSLVTRINRGPMFFDEHPTMADREEVMTLVRKRWRLGLGAPLFICPALDDTEENQQLMHGLGFRLRSPEGWRSARIDLRPSEDDIRRRFTSVWRNRLKAALASGLTLSIDNNPETIAWMLDRHEENMRAKKFNRPKRKLLHALHHGPSGEYCILRAHAEGKPVGMMTLAKFGRVAEYYVGWFGEEGRKYNCGNFLYWNALCEARKAGHEWFDLGGYNSDDKYGRFKQNMRGTEYRLCGEWLGI